MRAPKVLVIRFSSIGDIVLTTPVVRVLKRQIGAEVHYCTKAQFAELVQLNPYIDRLMLLEDSLEALIQQLRHEQYDYLIDLHHNLRTFRIKMALWGVKAYSFPKLNIEKELRIHLGWNCLPARHVVDRYLEAARPLGVSCDDEGLDFFIDDKAHKQAQAFLPKAFPKAYVAYAMGAKWATKKLPLLQMIALCRHIDRPVVLLGGRQEADEGRAIEQKLAPKVVNLCGQLSIAQSAALVQRATHVFAHDTGLMHIAAAFKKHVYAIFGSTIPEFGVAPYRTKHTLLENQHLRCRPCTKFGRTKCPKKHFACMTDLRFDFTLS